MFIEYLSDKYINFFIYYYSFEIKYNLNFEYCIKEEFKLLKILNFVFNNGLKIKTSFLSFNEVRFKNLFCIGITDEGLKHLSNCHTLDLSNCDKVTDEGLKHLSNCHTLDLSFCHNITDEMKTKFSLSKLSWT